MRATALLIFLPALLAAQQSTARTTNWPVFGGTTDNTHYSTLSQISPENVSNVEKWPLGTSPPAWM